MPAELGTWADARLARLRDLPRLGQADWPVVAGAHTGRYPRPRRAPSRSGLAEHAGLAEGWWPLLSTCVVRQVVELDEEAGLPSLLRGPFGAWTGAHLPQWAAATVSLSTVRGLRGKAVELDVELSAGLQLPATCVAEELVRLAVDQDLRSWGRHLGMTEQPLSLPHWGGAPLLATRLWDGDADRDTADLALMAARGHLGLPPAQWFRTWRDLLACPPAVVFERRGPAPTPGLPSPRPRMVVSEFGQMRPDTAAAATAAVQHGRAQLRGSRTHVVPRGGPRFGFQLKALLLPRRAQEVHLRWQPVATGPIRETPVLLTGLEVDEEGTLWLLAVWEASLVVVPVPYVVGIGFTVVSVAEAASRASRDVNWRPAQRLYREGADVGRSRRGNQSVSSLDVAGGG
ncbi:hypothetical protein [Oryzihumus leptocrescens]|nr:hypothetical protein [Oryzihumus leptocrescens]